MGGHHEIDARPITTRPFFTPGVWVMVGLIAFGMIFWAIRFIWGIGAVTNLDDQYPWGIWIGIDVATGVALAAGGFTVSALAHIFHRERYLALVRPALLTAMLGYTFVGVGLMFDLGRYYNIWHPVIMWQGNSVLFEVGICVVCYLHVLYIEFLPVVAERFKDGVRLPGPLRIFNGLVEGFLNISDRVLKRSLFIFIILGVVLSFMHQSSLGTLMLIAPTKMHPLWFTPIMPLLFLGSAIMVGFPMVMFESLIASRSFRLKPETHLLAGLGRIVPIFLLIYLGMKVSDLVIREAYVYLFRPTLEAGLFATELLVGLVVPLFILLNGKLRQSPKGLFAASALIVFGVALNRVNVFLVAYRPPYAETPYIPALGEVAITVSLISLLVLCYRFVALNFPVIAGHPLEEAAVSKHKS